MGAEEVFIISDIETATSILGTEWLLIEDPNTKGLYKKVSTQEVVKGFINGYPIDNTDIADGRILSFDAANSKFIYVDPATGGGGSGDMTKAVYDPQTIESDAFDRTNHTGEQAISTVTNLQTELDNKQKKSSEISPVQEIVFNGETKSQVDQTTDLFYTVAASQPNAPAGSGVHYETITIRPNQSNTIGTDIPISNNQSFDDSQENTFIVSYDPDKVNNKAIGYIGKVPLTVAPTQPLYVSSEIGSVDDQTLTLTADVACDFDPLGITLNSDGGALSIVANTAGDGTITGNYSLNRAVINGEIIDVTIAATNSIVNSIDGVTQMTAVTSQSVTNNVAANLLPDALLEFSFNDDTVTDLTGNGNNGTITGTGATYSSTAVDGRSLNLTSAQSNLRITTPLEMGQIYSRIAIVRWEGNRNSAIWTSDENVGTNYKNMQFINSLQNEVRCNDANNNRNAASVTSGSFILIAEYFNGDTGASKVWIDNGTAVSTTLTPTTVSGTVYIGQLNNNTEIQFNGYIDHMWYLDREITDQEVLDVYNTYLAP